MKDNTLKLFHTADLHLGSPFMNLPANVGDTLRKEQKDILFRIIKLCRDEAVDILLLAGDVFDRPHPDKEIVQLFIGCMNEIPETEIFITPGNHDPYLIDSPWDSVTWPSHVHVFSPDCQTFVSEKNQVQIDGSAFASYLARESLFGGIDRQVPANYFRLLMWHGDLTDQKSDYNPLSRNLSFLLDYDYVAMGHIHKENEIPLSVNSKVIIRYSGCPQGRGFDELGESHFWLGELSKVKEGMLVQNWQKIPVGSRPFLWIYCDLTGCVDLDAVKSRVQDSVKNSVNGSPDIHLYSRSLIRIVLQGRLPEDLIIDAAFIENYLKSIGCFFVQVRLETKINHDLERLADQPGFTGLLVQNYKKRMAKAQTEQQKQELEQALEYVFLAGQGDL